jgi:hypothetical protein
MLGRCLFGAWLLAATAAAADKWNVSFFHDEKDSTLTLGEIVFPSERRGIAIGVLNDKGRIKPVAVVTGDGGDRWEMVPLKDVPVTISCVNDSACWLATDGGVWFTEEAGRTWRKVSRQKGILTMHFDSATHGFAGGEKKSIWETKDGGKTWTPIEATKEISAKPEFAVFHSMGFGGKTGLIAGTSRPPRREDLTLFPPWMEPERAAQRREWPNLMMLAETRDGGATWKLSSASIFGMVSRIVVDPAGFAVALLQFGETFEVPAEVSQIDFKTGKMIPLYRNKEHAVTDVAYLPNRSIVAAGTQPSGLRSLQLPGKVVIREAAITDVTKVGAFTEQAVDYRAVARQVKLAVAPDGQLWATTDAGMILRLDRAAVAVK